MRRLPLRYRVAVGYGLIGLLLSLAFAAATTYIADDYEEIFVNALLDGQADTYLRELAADPTATLPQSPSMTLYRQAEAPVELRSLRPGHYELGVGRHVGVHAGIFTSHGQTLVAVLDVGQIETLETYLAKLMLGVVVFGTVLSALAGWLLAARAIRPVVQLAKAVEALPPRPAITQLAAGYSSDTVGRLADAIDTYQARLVDADEKERRFFADASHELRTPIAVIQGAVEVLSDDPATTSSQLLKLGRIDRGIAELASMLEALLLSARGLPEQAETLDLQVMWTQALARLSDRDAAGASRVALDGAGLPAVRAPRRWVGCIIDVLLLKILSAAPAAHWRVSFSTLGFIVHQPPESQVSATDILVNEIGLGVIFIERLARRMSWEFRQQVMDTQGLSISIRIPSSALVARND